MKLPFTSTTKKNEAREYIYTYVVYDHYWKPSLYNEPKLWNVGGKVGVLHLIPWSIGAYFIKLEFIENKLEIGLKSVIFVFDLPENGIK